MTQPILLQSFVDESELPDKDHYPSKPANPGSICIAAEKMTIAE
jgi:hypothetical protein